MRFWLPWWLFPVYALVWVCFLPLWIVLWIIRAAGQRRERRRGVVQVTVRVHEKRPSQSDEDGEGQGVGHFVG